MAARSSLGFVVSLAVGVPIAASGCGTVGVQPVTYLTRVADAPKVSARPYDCAIDHYESDDAMPAHDDLAEIETTCASVYLRDRDQVCARELRRQACALGATAVHRLHTRIETGKVTITAVAARARDRATE